MELLTNIVVILVISLVFLAVMLILLSLLSLLYLRLVQCHNRPIILCTHYTRYLLSSIAAAKTANIPERI